MAYMLKTGKNKRQDMQKNHPLLVVMTPVRNEAWVLHAFLKATSLWADYIIIADQHSTDGSREIALQYSKVILIDNNNPNFNEAERQKILVDRAREIDGEKILFGLDADEIFSANFHKTKDWQKILNSKPGDVFWFKWAEICPDKKHYWSSAPHYPWMFHDDGEEPHGNYVKNMHSMRIPYPIEEKQMYYVNDFRVLHLAYLNMHRVDAKRRFYKFVDWEMNKRSIISLSRSYAQVIKGEEIKLPVEFINYTFDLYREVDLNTTQFWFDQYIIERLNNYPVKKLKKIDLWEKEFLVEYNLKDPRNVFDKWIHCYLKKTKKIRKKRLVRLIDKLFKKHGY